MCLFVYGLEYLYNDRAVIGHHMRVGVEGLLLVGVTEVFRDGDDADTGGEEAGRAGVAKRAI